MRFYVSVFGNSQLNIESVTRYSPCFSHFSNNKKFLSEIIITSKKTKICDILLSEKKYNNNLFM